MDGIKNNIRIKIAYSFSLRLSAGLPVDHRANWRANREFTFGEKVLSIFKISSFQVP